MSLFCENNDCARPAARSFDYLHRGKLIHHKYALELMGKFRENGFLQNRKHKTVSIVGDEVSTVGILQNYKSDPSKLTCRMD